MKKGFNQVPHALQTSQETTAKVSEPTRLQQPNHSTVLCFLLKKSRSIASSCRCVLSFPSILIKLGLYCKPSRHRKSFFFLLWLSILFFLEEGWRCDLRAFWWHLVLVLFLYLSVSWGLGPLQKPNNLQNTSISKPQNGIAMPKSPSWVKEAGCRKRKTLSKLAWHLQIPQPFLLDQMLFPNIENLSRNMLKVATTWYSCRGTDIKACLFRRSSCH